MCQCKFYTPIITSRGSPIAYVRGSNFSSHLALRALFDFRTLAQEMMLIVTSLNETLHLTQDLIADLILHFIGIAPYC